MITKIKITKEMLEEIEKLKRQVFVCKKIRKRTEYKGTCKDCKEIKQKIKLLKTSHNKRYTNFKEKNNRQNNTHVG